jgi:hypothetical protein
MLLSGSLKQAQADLKTMSLVSRDFLLEEEGGLISGVGALALGGSGRPLGGSSVVQPPLGNPGSAGATIYGSNLGMTAAPVATPSSNYVSEREVRRLEASVREVSEVNDRIMAQNIALLADLEAAQRTVRELRAGKDALALQLKRALSAAAK